MKNVEDLAHSNIVANSRPPSEEKHRAFQHMEDCPDAALARVGACFYSYAMVH